MAEVTGGREARGSQQQTSQRPATASARIQNAALAGSAPGAVGTKQPSARQMVAFLDSAARAGVQQQPSMFPPSESLPGGVLGHGVNPPPQRQPERQRPQSATPLRTSGAPRLVNDQASPGQRQLGRMSLMDHGTPDQAPHQVAGPVIVRELSKPRVGFPARPPEKFLKAGEGLSLWQRNKLKEHLKLNPVNIEAPFVPGSGGVRMPPQQPTGADGRVPAAPSASTSRNPLPHSLLRTYYDNGTLDFVAVRWRGNRADALVWSRSVSKGFEDSPAACQYTSWGPEPPAELDVATWLPIFIEGVREYEEPYKFLAVRGSEELLYKAGGGLHRLADSLVSCFRCVLDTREPTVVAVALQLMTAAVQLDPQLAGEWARSYWQFAQVLNLFRSRGGRLVVDMGYNKRAVASCRRLAGTFMTEFELAGGEVATAAVRRYSPGHDPAVTAASMDRAAAKAAAKAVEAGRKPGEFKPFTLF